jgi:hypothetical protein
MLPRLRELGLIDDQTCIIVPNHSNLISILNSYRTQFRVYKNIDASSYPLYMATENVDSAKLGGIVNADQIEHLAKPPFLQLHYKTNAKPPPTTLSKSTTNTSLPPSHTAHTSSSTQAALSSSVLQLSSSPIPSSRPSISFSSTTSSVLDSIPAQPSLTPPFEFDPTAYFLHHKET